MENNQAPLLAAEKAQLSELEKIVQQAIDEENSIIYTLKNPIAEILTKGQSISVKWHDLVEVGSLSSCFQPYCFAGSFLMHYHQKALRLTLIHLSS